MRNGPLRLQLQTRMAQIMTMMTGIWRMLSLWFMWNMRADNVACATFKIAYMQGSVRFPEPWGVQTSNRVGKSGRLCRHMSVVWSGFHQESFGHSTEWEEKGSKLVKVWYGRRLRTWRPTYKKGWTSLKYVWRPRCLLSVSTPWRLRLGLKMIG